MSCGKDDAGAGLQPFVGNIESALVALPATGAAHQQPHPDSEAGRQCDRESGHRGHQSPMVREELDRAHGIT
jgi:hypothetical protein